MQNTAAGTARILTYFVLSLLGGASQALLLRWNPYPEGRMSNRWLSGWAGTAALYLALYEARRVSDGGQLVANYSPSRKRHRCADVWCVWQNGEDWPRQKKNKQTKKKFALVDTKTVGTFNFFLRCSRWLARMLHVKDSARRADSSQWNKEDSAHGGPLCPLNYTILLLC